MTNSLASYLTAQNLTFAAFARLSGIHARTISAIAKGRRTTRKVHGILVRVTGLPLLDLRIFKVEEVLDYAKRKKPKRKITRAI